MLRMGEQRGTHNGSLATFAFGFLSNSAGLAWVLNWKDWEMLQNPPVQMCPKKLLWLYLIVAPFTVPTDTPHTDFKGKLY